MRRNMSTKSLTVSRSTNADATRLFSKTTLTNGDLGCWQFTGCLNRDGYGRFYSEGKSWLAHRVAYELANGPIPAGLTVDHTCNNRACIRYEHLEAVTPAENSRRAAERRTHCKNGHEYTESNTYHHRGKRHCRTCNRLAVRRYALRKRKGGGRSQ
jgi:hypothetical protein